MKICKVAGICIVLSETGIIFSSIECKQTIKIAFGVGNQSVHP